MMLLNIIGKIKTEISSLAINGFMSFWLATFLIKILGAKND